MDFLRVSTFHYAVTYLTDVNAVLGLGIAWAMALGSRVLSVLKSWWSMMGRLSESWKDAELIGFGYQMMTMRGQTVWAVNLNTLKIPQQMYNLPTNVNKRQQLRMWKHCQSTASLKPLVCAVMYLVCCCSSRLLPQVSSASTVARAPSLSCLSQQCVPFMCLCCCWFLVFCRGLWHRVLSCFDCSSGSHVVQCIMRGSEFVFCGGFEKADM